MVKTFADFLNEELNYSITDYGDIEFEDRWFYYEPDDEIIYGCDNKPINTNNLFYFNPKSCEIYLNNEKHEYEINNPVLIISYEFKTNEVKLYNADNVFEYLEELGVKLNFDIQSQRGKKEIQTCFDNLDDKYRLLFLYGNKLISSTFDIIEEN
ncbi:MAG: hypothetical protein NC548_42590 [Lachnospiraceae bacterium]|nr:hypothetical protein [Lachnospiraceae bacterium]